MTLGIEILLIIAIWLLSLNLLGVIMGLFRVRALKRTLKRELDWDQASASSPSEALSNLKEAILKNRKKRKAEIAEFNRLVKPLLGSSPGFDNLTLLEDESVCHFRRISDHVALCVADMAGYRPDFIYQPTVNDERPHCKSCLAVLEKGL